MEQIPHPAEIGAAYEGGFYGGPIRIGNAVLAIAWAPKAEGETSLRWHPKNQNVPGAASCNDSMANTVAMAEAGSALGQWARSLNIAGHTDWCVPARDVLELGYRLLKPGARENCCSFRDGDNPSSLPAGFPYTEMSPPQTVAEPFHAGGAEAFDEVWHWASTQASAGSAWCQHFHDGGQGHDGKSYEGRARAVRLIQLNP